MHQLTIIPDLTDLIKSMSVGHWTKKSMFGLWRFFWILRQTNSVQFNLWTLFLTSVSELWLFPLELNFFVSNRTYFFLKVWLGSKEEKNTAFFFSEVWLKKRHKEVENGTWHCEALLFCLQILLHVSCWHVFISSSGFFVLMEMQMTFLYKVARFFGRLWNYRIV